MSMGKKPDYNEFGEVKAKSHAARVLPGGMENYLTQIIDGMAIPAFVIDNRHTVTHWNQACERLTGIPSAKMIGTRDAWKAFYPKERPVLADLIMQRSPESLINQYYKGKYSKSKMIDNAYVFQDFFPHLGDDGKWLYFTATPLMNDSGDVIGAIETFQDFSEQKQAEKNAQIAEQWQLAAQKQQDALQQSDAWYRSPYLWLAVGVVIGAGGVIGAVSAAN